MTQWIAGITRGHNAGVCLLKDGEIVFAVEEEDLLEQSMMVLLLHRCLRFLSLLINSII